MIGWYIHHQGRGHLHRALTLAAHLGPEMPVTGLSSLPAPAGWPGEWVRLAPDWEGSGGPPPRKPDAGGALHWAPLGHPGMRERSAQISAWIRETAPELFIADVSVEAALLARLHGVPVVTVALPGDRTDPPHQLGRRISEAVLGFWPEAAEGIVRGPGFHERGPREPGAGSAPPFYALGGLSRFAPEETTTPPAQDHGEHVLVLNGGGGGELPEEALAAIRQARPQATVTVLGAGGSWTDDPWPLLRQADVVVTSAGQNSVAEVAASRTPAVVLAQERPYEEQAYMRQALTAGPWPAVAAPEGNTAAAWGRALQEAMALDGDGWASWCDGRTTQRFLTALEEIRGRAGKTS